MKALTLTQPWATLVAIGDKGVETRAWRTDYREPLAIHAAKAFPPAARATTHLPDFLASLVPAGYQYNSQLPLGAVLAIVTLVDCKPTSVCTLEDLGDVGDVGQIVREQAFGDFSAGRYAWLLDDLFVLDDPVPSRGRLGLWEWEPPETVEVAYQDHRAATAQSQAKRPVDDRTGPYGR